MEAAIVAAKRGHDVTLFEKETKVGGQWLLAAIPPGKEVLNTLTVWQKGEMKRQGVKVEYNNNVDEKFIDTFAPDHIVLATGSKAIIPNIGGVDQEHVYTAADVLSGRVDLAGPIVVIGGGLVGSETAEHIAVHNQSVSIVEMMSDIATDMEGGSKSFMMDSLNHYNVPVYTNSKVIDISRNEVIVETEKGRKNIAASQVILAIGSKPHIPFSKSVLDKYNVELIGDAKTVGKALEGIQDAFTTAVEL
jgi:pyruvate/2-oxoglutarate dehydrogenase complex dihydrolipoamide dehydrogenase (E3) component